MARFLQDSDYDTLIKEEIRRLLDGRAPDGTGTSVKLIRAESMAVQQIRNRLAQRYDCDAIFNAAQSPVDLRDQFIVMITIDLTLYHLYSQTGNKDIPKHRNDRYADAVDWLKDVGTGVQPANLPGYPDDTADDPPADMRISSDPQENYRY